MAFVHPDLGIGGAERLVLDVAVALADQGVQVIFVTNHFDESHAFEELKSKRFPVRVIGDWIPRSICGKFQALCAYIRMIYLALVYTLFLRHQDKPDVYFVDQIPMAVPFIKLAKGKVIYYCHHPDLLASLHDSKLKKLYRMPIDWLEMYGTSKSDLILVNSQYTASVFRNTFPSIESDIQILYPTIALSYQEMISRLSSKDINTLVPEIENHGDNTIFLSINRFHPAKKLELAINAMESLKAKVSKNKWDRTYLVMAGGYDPRSAINAKYFTELVNMVKKKDLLKNVIFLKSPSDGLKADLLLACDCLIYTPVNEHFGIVPLEAMSAGKPVIACNSGGPCETVEHNVTGYLCPPRSESLANSMNDILTNRNASIVMGHNGKQQLEAKFSYKHFHDQVMDVTLQGIGCSSVIDSSSNSSSK